MSTEPEVPPRRSRLRTYLHTNPDGSRRIVETDLTVYCGSCIEYVPASAQVTAVEDFRRRAIKEAKKLQIGGLSRTHVYTMLQNLKAIPNQRDELVEYTQMKISEARSKGLV